MWEMDTGRLCDLSINGQSKGQFLVRLTTDGISCKSAYRTRVHQWFQYARWTKLKFDPAVTTMAVDCEDCESTVSLKFKFQTYTNVNVFAILLACKYVSSLTTTLEKIPVLTKYEEELIGSTEPSRLCVMEDKQCAARKCKLKLNGKPEGDFVIWLDTAGMCCQSTKKSSVLKRFVFQNVCNFNTNTDGNGSIDISCEGEDAGTVTISVSFTCSKFTAMFTFLLMKSFVQRYTLTSDLSKYEAEVFSFTTFDKRKERDEEETKDIVPAKRSRPGNGSVEFAEVV